MKKTQVATEALIVISFMLVFFLVLFFVVGTQFISAAEQQTVQPFSDIHYRLTQEIKLAYESPEGYTRSVTLPSEVNNVKYILSLEQQTADSESVSSLLVLDVPSLEQTFTSYFPERVTGQPCPGRISVQHVADGVVLGCISAGSTLFGGRCEVTSHCASGLVCDRSLCRFAFGSACDDSAQCSSQAVCEEGSCRSSLGNRCSANSDCVLGSSCLDSVCVGDGTVALGSACSASQQCVSGACSGDVCGYKLVVVAGTGEKGFKDGAGSDAKFDALRDVELSGNNLLVADSGNHVVRLLTPRPRSEDEGGGYTYTVSTVAGSAGLADFLDGSSASARFNQSAGLAVDSGGNVFVTDAGNNRVRLLTPDGNGGYAVSTIAGDGSVGVPGGVPGESNGDGGPALQAQFNKPHGIALDGAGNLFVVDRRNNRVRLLTPKEGGGYDVSTIITRAIFNAPNDVVVDGGGSVFVTDAGNNHVRLLALDERGRRLLVDFEGFTSPHGVALDGDGNLFVSDFSSRVFLLTPDGDDGYVMSTIAGTGMGGSNVAEDGSALNSQFLRPRGLAVDDRGNVFVADTDNHRIVKLCVNASDC